VLAPNPAPVFPRYYIYPRPFSQAGFARLDERVAKFPPRFQLAALPTSPGLLCVVGLLKVRIEFALRPKLRLAGAKLADFGLVKLGSVYKLDNRHFPIFLSTLTRLASGYLPVSGQFLSLPKICYVILHIVVESQGVLNTWLKKSGASWRSGTYEDRPKMGRCGGDEMEAFRC